MRDRCGRSEVEQGGKGVADVGQDHRPDVAVSGLDACGGHGADVLALGSGILCQAVGMVGRDGTSEPWPRGVEASGTIWTTLGSRVRTVGGRRRPHRALRVQGSSALPLGPEDGVVDGGGAALGVQDGAGAGLVDDDLPLVGVE